MLRLTSAFADELTKVAFGGSLQSALIQAQTAVAQKLLGTDPRVPTPFAESRLDDAIGKMRMQQRLVEMNRMQMGMPPESEEKTAMLGYMTPRTVKRIIQNTGYDDRDPGFQSIARQLTGESDINRMTQYQLKTLSSIMLGRPV